MSKFFTLLLFAISLSGISACSSSECQKVKDLESPAYEALLESEQLFEYWKNEESLEKTREINVCRDKLKINMETLQAEKVGEVCAKETGVNTESTLKAVESAQSQYEDSLEKWRKIVKLYPDCFDPAKVIKANS